MRADETHGAGGGSAHRLISCHLADHNEATDVFVSYSVFDDERICLTIIITAVVTYRSCTRRRVILCERGRVLVLCILCPQPQLLFSFSLVRTSGGMDVKSRCDLIVVLAIVK